MPPPPMVPGRHNIDDIGSWESPKNGSAMVPPPVPVPVPSPPPTIDEPSPLSQHHYPKPNQTNNSQANNASNIDNNNRTHGPPSHSSQRYGEQNDPRMQRGGPEGPRDYRNDYRERTDRDRGERDFGRGSDRDGYMQRPSWNNDRPSNRGNGHYQPNPRPSYGPSYHQGERGPHSGMSSQRPPYRPPGQPQHPYNRGYERSDSEGEPAAPPRSLSPPITRAEVPEVKEADAEEVDDNLPVVEELMTKHNYNPTEMNIDDYQNARFFIIKSYSEDDVHRSIKYEIWCSTDHGNQRLDKAFRDTEREHGSVYLFFSVNGSGHFCGIAQMMTAVDYNSVASVWHQDKWKGQFKVKWVYVKDVPNTQLRHIRLENNENKPVTNSRDTQEVPNDKGLQVLEIIHSFKHSTSIFNDFIHYEKREVLEDTKKVEPNESPFEAGDEGRAPHHYQGGRPFHPGGSFRDGGYDNRPRNNYGKRSG